MMDESWDPVFNPKEAVRPHERAQAYISQAGSDILVARPFKLPPWDAKRLMERLRAAEDKSGGLDGWRPAHWRLVTEEAVCWLATLLPLIADGQPWPQGTLVAKSVLIRKPSTQWDQPLTLRTITILALL